MEVKEELYGNLKSNKLNILNFLLYFSLGFNRINLGLDPDPDLAKSLNPDQYRSFSLLYVPVPSYTTG